ncbi:hypothetical protein N8I77_002206 [Diaporthe amygdali]|uniref:Extracellular membrane protein CFEM domain-containing protein n=1 Tax=Phomopsis amygdali TaxID=1214568 RepID=A0AAD9SUA2_PHOAM|nr:hypothetical protein N8I77_002206 [Diaporthe amygdali]
MLFPRMAVRRSRLLLWATMIPLFAATATETAAVSSTGEFDLGSDFTAFIPSCAVSCFQSFLEVNFETDLCGSSPTLQCLCSHTGSTGYTIGEGAVQCIVAENSIRACEGMSAGSDTVANAYGMCDNQPNAAPATHATIIATLIVPPTGPVVVPNPSTTATVSSNRSSTTSYMTPSVTVAPTLSTSFLTSSSSSFSTSTSSSSSSSSSAPTNATAAPETSGTNTAAPARSLSTAQIGGIAGGSAAAVLLAAVVGLFCFMRRRRGKAVTGFYQMRDSWSPRRKDSPEISAPQYREPKSMSFTRALAQRANRASARPDTIGLAISPEGNGMQGAARQPDGTMVAANLPLAPAAVAQRRSASPPPIPALSPLRTQGNFNFFSPQQQFTNQQQQQPASAAKPALTVDIPAAKSQPAARSSTMSNNRMPFSGGRDSVVTEFAEDGETSAGLGSAQIWRPPNTDPQSASTYYVADKWGNWVLGGSGPDEHIVELPTPVSKTIAEKDAEQDRAVQESDAVKAAVKDLSSPTLGATAPAALRLSRAAGAPGKPTIRHVAPESGRLPINTRSSSVYSNFSMNFSLPQTVQPGPNNPMPTSAGSRKEPSPTPESYYVGGGAGGKQQGRDLTSRPRRRSNSTGGGTRDRTNTMMSQDSTTTIASSVGSEVGVDSFPAPSRQSAAPDQQGSLSPVVESPGRSPVSYPKIPRPRSNVPLNRAADAPVAKKPLQHPGLRVVNSTPSDSPTLGIVDSQKPVQVGPVAAAAPAQARVSYYNPPRRNPNPNRNPGQVRSGSPETPTSQQQQQQQQMPQPLAVPSNKRDTIKSPPLQTFQQHIDNRSQLPSQSHSRYGPMSVYDAYSRPESNLPAQQQQQQRHYQQYYYPQQQQYQNEPGGPYSFSPSPASASDSPSISNTTTKTDSQSSLLAAKRLGAERAAALQIGGESAEARQARWKRRTSSLGKAGGGAAAPDGVGAAASLPPKGVVFRQAGRGSASTRESDVPLPATPGWKPQLTPKRRGDDLFLSVQ